MFFLKRYLQGKISTNQFQLYEVKPLNYKLCYLYGLKSKTKLRELLHIDRTLYCKGSFVNQKINPYVSKSGGKERLIEAPEEDIKKIQGIILKSLQQLDYPEYSFSGIKGKCYIDNAKKHQGFDFLFKVDISKFFPNTSRDKVYRLFVEKLKTSPDVANILANFSTVNLSVKNNSTVLEYVERVNIKQNNHLITGSPISAIMSYLANIDMFEKMYQYAEENKINMTVYIDDVVFSANHNISYVFRNKILQIIKDFGYDISIKKCKWYSKGTVKKVTGVILDKDNSLQVPNRLIKKVHDYISEEKAGDDSNYNNLQGCLVVSEQINGKFGQYRKQLLKERKKQG